MLNFIRGSQLTLSHDKWSKITELSHTHEGLVKTFGLASCTMHPNFALKYSTKMTKNYMSINEKSYPNLCWHSLIQI